MKRQKHLWLSTLVLVALVGLWGLAGCGDDSARTPSGDKNNNNDDPNNPNNNNNDPNNPNNNNNDPNNPNNNSNNNVINPDDIPPIGQDVPPDSKVMNIQEQLNNGAISVNGTMVMPNPTSAVEVEGTTDWRYGSRAAYSIVHDDICDYQMTGTEKGWELARDRSLPVGWGIIVSRCQRLGFGDPDGVNNTPYWNLVKDMQAGGQEIANHSYTHPDIRGLSQCAKCASAAQCDEVCPSAMRDINGNLVSDDISVLNNAAGNQVDVELVKSGVDTKAESGIDLNFYVFPLDVADDNMFEILKGQNYWGARGGDRDMVGTLNSWDVDLNDPLADFRITFDAYNEDTKWASRHMDKGADQMLSEYLNAAVRDGKWALRELHSIRPSCGVTGHGWGAVTEELYIRHLDNMVDRIAARQVWMAPNVDIIKYRRSRAHCGAPQLSGTTLSFANGSSAECQKYATPVTVALQGPADTTISNVSSGEYTNLPQGRVLVTMDPTASVNITFGTGNTPVATHAPDTYTQGLNPDVCSDPPDCQPLGECNCDEPLLTKNAYDPNANVTSDAGACDAYGAASIDICDLSAPEGYRTIPMGSDGYCEFPNQQWPAVARAKGKDGAQWGAQMSFYGDGLVGSPKTCMNASSHQGVRVCVQGEIKNAFPKTRYVATGTYDISDTTRNPTEVQNVAWIYMITDYTAKTSDWNAGHCTDENCAHPFYQLETKPGAETCADIKWSDFQFPYWWGDANVGFIMPEVCAQGGQVPPADVCQPGEDYDPLTEEPLAKWHACNAMADKIIFILVAAVDDIGSDPVETQGFKAKVSFF